MKKLNVGACYRAKLDDANRLMLQFARVESASGHETVCLALEVIENHAYERSRFLRGATVDEARIEREPPAVAAQADTAPLRCLAPGRTVFELLDKPIVFDDAQEAALLQPAPLVASTCVLRSSSTAAPSLPRGNGTRSPNRRRTSRKCCASSTSTAPTTRRPSAPRR